MATLVLVLNFCGLPRRALAAPTQAPTQNFTALRTDIAPPWVPDPDNRGTWSLLYSCVFTLVLCVWTAIHLNVPSYHESQRSQWLRKLKWVLLAIIAGELGVCTAFEQYIQAKELIAQLAEISVKIGSQGSYRTNRSQIQLSQKSQDSDPEKAASKRRLFSLRYGYYAVMGGLAVDVSDIDGRLHSLTLTPAGVQLLGERGHFLEVSDGVIRDKSKADIFAKSLVILQVTWIALQTISRKATGYPLSPLEIHTLVHAACASVMYSLWFQKPLDVQAPTTVSKAGFEDLTALMLMQNPRLGRTWYSDLDPPEDFEPMPGPKATRSEASFLMFDDTALSRRNEGCSSCGGDNTPSTTTNTKVADKDVLHTIPDSCDGCVDLSNSGRQQAITSEARTLSSPITSHPPSGIRCEPPPGVKAVYELRSGEFTPEGIGLQPLITGRSHHDIYVTEEGWFGSLWRCLIRCPPKPALPVQISPTLKERLPEPSSQSFYEKAQWHEINLSLSEKDLKRWKLAGAAFLKEMEIQEVSRPGNGRYWNLGIAQSRKAEDIANGRPRTKRLLAWRRRNVNGKLPDEGAENRFSLVLLLLASLYGGVHLALWNYDFPTPLESLLWRISAATLGSMPVVLVLLRSIPVDWLEKIFPRFWSRVRDIWDRLQKKFPRFCSGVRNILNRAVLWGALLTVLAVTILMIVVTFAAAMLIYTLARIFIVVESFISLRHVPIGVYEGGLGWSRYIPHL